MLNTLWINADHARDLCPLVDHVTKLKHFTKGDIHEFSVFPFSLHLMFEQILSNLIVCLMISQKLHAKVAQPN